MKKEPIDEGGDTDEINDGSSTILVSNSCSNISISSGSIAELESNAGNGSSNDAGNDADNGAGNGAGNVDNGVNQAVSSDNNNHDQQLPKDKAGKGKNGVGKKNKLTNNPCSECAKSYTQINNLRRHQRQQHPHLFS